MATISYGFGGTNVVLANGVTNGAQWAPAFASNPAGTRHVAVWTSNAAGTDVVGRLFAGINPRSDEFAVSPPAPFFQTDASIAGLADGRFIVTYTDTQDDPGGDIRARLLDTDGMPAGSIDILVDGIDLDRSDVAALAGGGYVVSWIRHDPGGGSDIHMNVYRADGSASVFNGLVSAGTTTTGQPSVTGLAGGGFVVAWHETPAGGGDTEVRFRRYDATGARLDASPVLIDTAGINRDVEVAALPDGGFVVAYEDTSWGNGKDITARIYNADGTARTDWLHVNAAANGGNQAGDQSNPKLALLSSGVFTVGWGDGNSFRLQAYNASGIELGQNALAASNASENEIVQVGGGMMADIWRSSVSDGSGDSIRLTYHTFFRVIEGDAGSETIVGIDDGIREVLSGLDGNDTLEGREGSDSLRGGDGFDLASYASAPVGVTASLHSQNLNTGHANGDDYHSVEGLLGSPFDDTLTGDIGPNVLDGREGNDTLTGRFGHDALVGGLGEDTAAFLQNLGQYTVEDFGDRVRVSGPDGGDFLYSIEHLRFTDATLTPVDDGNPLFDALYYYSRNTDVYFAGVDALAHFNASGRHEGRDPNAYFDTSGYLAVTQDVAAIGANPLEHYHQAGWQEGRDPSAWFDTTLYMIRNPDVAAAGVDPLAHYLQFGFAEGRQAHQAIGASIVGGFDAQFYLFHNSDVAAAGVDPLAHYETSGWHEGRNPNAWFDTAGYLAHYADVAAAGVNPLTHYMQFGWQEGRDPSAGFDTLGYLAANADVAAGGANPLAHYLQFGVYEGRQVVNDAMWG